MSLYVSLAQLARWFRKCVSESWPTSQATVLSGRIADFRGYYRLSMPYAFCAAGERYGGRYERDFRKESEAQERLQRLRESPPQVRYKPSNPDRSFLDED